MMRQQLISILVNDHPGVLQRISGLFARRGYNIHSITVGASENEGASRMVVTAVADDSEAEQICRQLRKLIDVIEAVRLNGRPVVSRELMMIKVNVSPETRGEIFDIIQTFRCSAVDLGTCSVVIQVVGDEDKNNAFLQLIRPYGVIELTRTGATAMNRGGLL